MTTTFYIICRPVKDPDTIDRITQWLNDRQARYMYFEGTGWFVNAAMNVTEVRDSLLHLINAGDFLFVMEAGPGWSAWNLNERQSFWLQKNWRPGLLRLK